MNEKEYIQLFDEAHHKKISVVNNFQNEMKTEKKLELAIYDNQHHIAFSLTGIGVFINGLLYKNRPLAHPPASTCDSFGQFIFYLSSSPLSIH